MTTEDQKINQRALRLLYDKNLYRINRQKSDEKLVDYPPPVQPSAISTPTATGIPVLIVSRTQLISGSGSSNLLESILKACRLQPESIRIISPFTPDITAETLKTNHQPNHVIMFGIGSSEIGLTVYFPDYQVQQVGGIQYLTAPDLLLLENDPEAKQKLWKSLKIAFSLS